MGSLGPLELILIFLAILLIFGAKRIPEIARGLGKGIKEFKSATSEISKEFKVNEPVNRINPAPPVQGQQAPRVETPVQAAAPPAVPPPATPAVQPAAPTHPVAPAPQDPGAAPDSSNTGQ